MSITEQDLIPYEAVSYLTPGPALIFAPHPDDEVFGCAGAIMAHRAAGDAVKIILVTDGGMQGDSTAVRLAESKAAAVLLGASEPICWELEDRGVHYGEQLISRMVDAIRISGARAIYAPWAGELHPDHRAVALAAREAVRRVGSGTVLAQYELSAPMRPNRLLNLMPYFERKLAAMRVFESQLAFNRYDETVSALNRYRAYTLAGQGVEAAEAYFVISAADLNKAPSSIPVVDVRLPRAGVDLPLVSVMIRSANRPTLRAAIESVAAQTYPNIEIVVVNTTAKPHTQSIETTLPIRLLEPGHVAPRPVAANILLDAAQGDWCIFLDDDDWMLPNHIERLVRAAMQGSELGAFTDIGCADLDGNLVPGVFDRAFDLNRLHIANFLPIHSVLFSRQVITRGCRFDESLKHFEDWDFWLQVGRMGALRHVPGVSAIYRIHTNNNSGIHDHDARIQGRQILLAKWARIDPDAVAAGAALRLTEAEDDLQRTVRDAQRIDEARGTAQTQIEAANRAAMESQGAVLQLRGELTIAQSELATLQQLQRVKDDEIRDLHELVASKNLILNKVEAEVAQLRELVANEDQNIANLRGHIEDKDRHIGNLDVHIANLDAQINAYMNSISWRLTKPIRLLGRLARVPRKGYRLLKGAAQLSGGWYGLFRRSIRIMRSEGVSGLSRRVAKLRRPQASVALPPVDNSVSEYESWNQQFYNIDAAARERMASEIATWEVTPLISIVMPTYNSPEEWLCRAIDSVREQVYPHWELCIADDASPNESVRNVLRRYEEADKRIRVVYRTENGHISAASNSALAICSGEFTALLDHDDELTPDAFYHVVKAIRANPEADLFYSDEDKIDIKGRRFDPYFKPDWNPDLFLSQNFFSHLGVYRTSVLRDIEGFRVGLEGSQDYDLALRAVERVGHDHVVHIPRVLYHWRVVPGSTAGSGDAKPYAYLAAVKAVEDHLSRTAINARVEEAVPGLRMLRVRYALPANQPEVTIVIPTRDGGQVLKRCLDSIRTKTLYNAYRILVVDNGSVDPFTLDMLSKYQSADWLRVRRDDRPFNYASLNNDAVKEVDSDLVCLLNDDTEVISPDWLNEMVSHVLRPGIGAVGCKLLYPNETLQHGGVILGLGGVAGHAHHKFAKSEFGYFGRAVLQQNLSAVTAACMVLRKDVFERVGGFNEQALGVAFNDVDLCLRIRESGYRLVWTPHAVLYHHESLSRGDDLAPEKVDRFVREVTWMRENWGSKLDSDPAYNPNLTLKSSDFALAWPPRTGEVIS